jgi:glutathione S-transferase
VLRQALPALVTCGAIALFLVLSFLVGRARVTYGVDAPATTGHPVFERHVRVQMNTLEQLVAFLPALWLFAFFMSPVWAAFLGLVWIAARIVYAVTYVRNPAARSPSFGVGMVVSGVLLIGAMVGVLRALGRTGLFGG